MMKAKELMKKMKMPMKKPHDLDIGEDSDPNLESLNSEEGQSLDEDMKDGESSEHRDDAAKNGGQLHTYSDDELIAEVKKRGLVKEIEDEGSPEEESSESPDEERQENDEMNS